MFTRSCRLWIASPVSVMLLAASAWGVDRIFLFDLSASVQKICEENKRVVEEHLAQSGPGSVMIIGITEASFSNPVVILPKVTLRDDPSPFGASLQRARVQALEEWKMRSRALQCNRMGTDILGAFQLAGFYSNGKSVELEIIAVTDGRHNTGGVDLESPKEVNPDVIQLVRNQTLIPNFNGATPRVCFLNVTTTGKGHRYIASLKNVWVTLLAEAGAELRDEDFTLDRRCSLNQ